MKTFRALGVGALLAAGCVLYLQPEIRELFQSTATNEDPLSFLRNLPEIEPKTEAPERRSRPSPASGNSGGSQSAPERQEEAALPEPADSQALNQVPNQELARVLLQILAARGLADGISIGVSDQEVRVYGSLRSREELRELNLVIERARESRRVNLEELKVAEQP